ncbi:MAG: zinc-dependent alcohol dehydrogenase [Desulfuromonadaceae bacterium]
MISTQQLWFTAPYALELREKRLPEPGPDEILVRSLCSGISSGTEMLAYRGQLPQNQALDASIDTLDNHSTAYPFQYGYANVGRVEAAGRNVDNSMLGKTVFALQPHATRYITRAETVIELPEGISPEAGIFVANMETAVNLILDARPMLGEHAVVLGQGIVGLLVTAILSRFPLKQLYALEQIPLRRSKAVELGAQHAIDPECADAMTSLNTALAETPGRGADLVIELTGSPAALNLALDTCAYTGRIIVGSWYGSKGADLDLGGRFHRERIRIISSQVSSISPELCGRWNRERRFSTALELIARIGPEQLITHKFALNNAPEAYKLLDRNPESALQTVLTYPDQ